jgi:DNA-binding response OmpR family regulator
MPDGRDGRVVLIVQEEFVIRMDVADAFDKAGFKVLQAGNAEEAITILKAEPSIRAVFIDEDLPRIDGVTLAHYVRERWPPTILLLSSRRLPNRALPSNTRFLQQPYIDGGLESAAQAVSNQIIS